MLFGSIGTLVETSEIQRKSFNEAFKKKGLDWYWTKEEYIKLLNKSGGSDRIKEYAKKKNTKVNPKKLRDLKTDNNLLLFKCEMDAGHGSRSGRKNIIEDIAFDYAFALKVANKI